MDMVMENTINKIMSAFRTYSSQILSDKNIKNLSGKIFSNVLASESKQHNSVENTQKNDIVRKNTVKYSKNEDNKIVVQVIRDNSGKIIRTIPLNEQHVLDVFE